MMRGYIVLTLALFTGWYAVLMLCLFMAEAFALSAMPHDVVSYFVSVILVALPALYSGWRVHQLQLVDTDMQCHIATRIAVQAVQCSIGLIVGIYMGFTSVDALTAQGWQMINIVEGLIILLGVLMGMAMVGLFAYVIAKPCVHLFLPK